MAISKQLHTKLKQLYPEGKSLEADRTREAETVFDSAKDIERWARTKDRTDFKGFDTPDAKEPPIRTVLKDLTDGDSGVEAIQDEPERFIDENSVAGSLIQKNGDKIVDEESFVKTVEQSWSQDKSLRNLVENIGGRTQAYNQMFRSKKIQDLIDKNTRPTMVSFVMKKFGVEPVRASRIVSLLPTNTRAKLFKRAKMSKLPRIRVQKKALKKVRWSEQELNIIRANKNLSRDKLYNLFRRTSGTKRSFGSVISKHREILKE